MGRKRWNDRAPIERAALIASLALGWANAGCAPDLVDGVFTEAEWTRIQTLSPLDAPATDSTNAVAGDPAAASLGQMLFFERDYSGPIVTGDDGTNGGLGAVGEEGRVACADCHSPASAFDDQRSTPNATSLGTDWSGRNSPTLINATFYEWFFWDGRADSLWSQALIPAESPGEMGGDRLRVAHVLFSQYRDAYDAIFDPDLDPALDPTSPDASRFPLQGLPGSAEWDAMAPADQDIVNRIYANFGKAIAAYELLLVARETPFDRYVAGDTSAISASAKRGLRVFIGRGACAECHDGPFLSDQEFHNLGVPQLGLHVPAEDLGRISAIPTVLASPFNGAGAFSDDPEAGSAALSDLSPDEALRGSFRTKSLREIARTAPYMHNGLHATLREVVEFYNLGGGLAEDGGFAGTVDPQIRALNLSEDDIDDLVAFLETLSADPLPAELLVDTSR